MVARGPGIAVQQGAAVRRRYLQSIDDIPIYGFGYYVTEEQGILRSAFGRIVAGSQSVSAVSPLIDEQQALDLLLQDLALSSVPWLDYPSTYSPPTAELMWVSRTGRPMGSDLELRWVFELAGSGLQLSHAQVAAGDGDVLAIDSKNGCFADGTTRTGNVGTGTVHTNYNGARSFPTVEYSTPSQTMSVPENDFVVGYAQTSSDPAVSSHCASSELGDWSEDPAREAATAFWGVVEADEYLASLGLLLDDEPWEHFDRDGARTLSTVWVPQSLATPDCQGNTVSNAYAVPPNENDPTDGGTIWVLGGSDGPPTNPAVMSHEYAHHVLDWARRLSDEDLLVGLRESGSIKEGFSDVFALASTRARVPNDPFWPCVPIDDACIRDLEDPTSTGLPDYYGLDPYVDYSGYDDAECGTACSSGPNNDRCGIHNNSTILGHWAHLLGTGSSTGNGVCAIDVEPLSQDEDESYQILLDVLLNTLARRVGPLVSFEDLKNATLLTAEDLYPGTDVQAKMRRAWLAVGLETYVQPDGLIPREGKIGVEPWLDWYPRLRWNAEGAGPWEIQFSNRSDFCDSSQSSCFVDEYEAVSDGAGDAVFDGKVRPDERLFWRARVNGAPSWEQCNIIAGGDFSTSAKKMRPGPYGGYRKVEEPDSPDSPTKISTNYLGNVVFEYDVGLDGYDYVYSKGSPDEDACDSASADTTDVPWFKVVDDPFWALGNKNRPYGYADYEIVDNDLNDGELGYLSIRPFALRGDEKVLGTCSTFEVKRKPLGGAFLLYPEALDVVPIDLFHPAIPPFSFTKSEDADEYTVRIYHHPTDAEPGTHEYVSGNLIYERTRSLGDCGLEEVDGEMFWNLEDCDDEPTNFALNHLVSGHLRWTLSMSHDNQTRFAVTEDNLNNITQGMFYLVPDHVPAEIEDVSGVGPDTFGLTPQRGWITLRARTGEDEPWLPLHNHEGMNPNFNLSEPETGTVNIGGEAFETIIYQYLSPVDHERDIESEPYRAELCLDTEFALASDILLAVVANGELEFQTPWIQLNEGGGKWCTNLDIRSQDWQAFVLTKDAVGHLSTRVTEIRLPLPSDGYPDPEDDDDDDDDDDDGNTECQVPAQVVMPGGLRDNAETATTPGSLDYEDPCDILHSYVFSHLDDIKPAPSRKIGWSSVEHATDYEVLVHPISLENEELVACRSIPRPDPEFAFNTDGESALGNVPISSTGGYEFIIRALNKSPGCNEAGPWSEVGAIVIVLGEEE